METKAAGVTGSGLVHYGVPGVTEAIPHAVLVCHGMGQQVRFETISAVAEALRREAALRGGEVDPVTVHVARANGQSLSRAEIAWKDRDAVRHAAHVYEAYWAPLTEGRVTLRDTLRFLFRAAWNGLRWSKLFRPAIFRRWMFDAPLPLTIGPYTFVALLAVVAVLLAQVVVIGYIWLDAAHRLKDFLVQIPPRPGEALVAWGTWLRALAPETKLGLSGIWPLLVWLFALIETLAARYFLIQYAGDVAAYVSPYRDSKFEELRHKIRTIGFEAGKAVYGFGERCPMVPEYPSITIVGHSLGSVVAYDTLNALIGLEGASSKEEARGVVERTRALITFGSPLDKTAFIFRMQSSDNQDWIREQLAASAQPLIIDYALYRKPDFRWVNLWSPMDIISGALNYYDSPAMPASDPRHVQNLPTPTREFPSTPTFNTGAGRRSNGFCTTRCPGNALRNDRSHCETAVKPIASYLPEQSI